MLPKYLTLILFDRFYLISLESRDLLGFYCALLTLISAPIFGSPTLEENAVRLRI